MTVWLHEHPAGRAPEFRLGRDGDFVVAEWVGVGVLRASADGARSEFVAAPNARTSDVERVVEGTAAAFLRHLRGEMTLHASAASLRVGAGARKAVAFVAPSGVGKSTMVAHLCAHARAEAALLSDDLLYIDITGASAVVTPSARVHRLLPDARAALARADGRNVATFEARRDDPVAGKADVAPKIVSSEATPLAAILLLVDDATARAPSLARLRGMAAFRALSESLFRFVLDDPEVQARDFDRLAQLAARVPLYALTRPRGFEHFAAAHALVVDLVAGANGAVAVPS